jgi:hypothetical protein
MTDTTFRVLLVVVGSLFIGGLLHLLSKWRKPRKRRGKHLSKR